MNNYHTTVQLREAIEFLQVKPNEQYIDGTFGGGGHTKAILDAGGRVLAIDQDDDALTYGNELLASYIAQQKLTLVKGNFANLHDIAQQNGFEHVSGVLLDIGVSGHQFDTPERGFSFQDAPLDMRMDQSLHVSAKDLVNGLRAHELAELFAKYGEEPFAKKIASVIAARRIEQPITRTGELADLIKRNVRGGKAHPATRVFQALRIAVNDELHSLEKGLTGAFQIVKNGGRVVIISFHSLEDRIVKQSFEELERKELGKIITKKPVVPTEDEIAANNRSRSAKLRVIEKV